MDFSTWLTHWLTRHPLKEPPSPDRADYTREVMATVRTLDRPVPAPVPARPWFSWPRPAFAVAAAAAGVALVIATATRSTPQVAREPSPSTLTLAESPEGDDQWIEETIQLLDQLDENDDLSQDAPGEVSDEDWLNELEMLDETDLASSS